MESIILMGESAGAGEISAPANQFDGRPGRTLGRLCVHSAVDIRAHTHIHILAKCGGEQKGTAGDALWGF